MCFRLTRVFRRSVGAGVLLSTSCPKCLLMCRQCRAGSSCFIYKKQWYPQSHSYENQLRCIECVMSYWMILKQMHPVTTSSYCALFLSFHEVWTSHKRPQRTENANAWTWLFPIQVSRSVRGDWWITLQASKRTSATRESCLTGTLTTWVSGMSTNTRLSRLQSHGLPSGGAVTCNLINPSSFC